MCLSWSVGRIQQSFRIMKTRKTLANPMMMFGCNRQERGRVCHRVLQVEQACSPAEYESPRAGTDHSSKNWRTSGKAVSEQSSRYVVSIIVMCRYSIHCSGVFLSCLDGFFFSSPIFLHPVSPVFSFIFVFSPFLKFSSHECGYFPFGVRWGSHHDAVL